MIDFLQKLFISKLRFKTAVGIDRVRPEVFEKNLPAELESIRQKIQDDRFVFSPYKEFLISKGRGRPPRVISIPTVRDKLVLSWLLSMLHQAHPVKESFIYSIVERVRSALLLGKVHYCKMDISGFYDNINHELLLSFLREVISGDQLISLTEKAIKNPTTPQNIKPSERNSVGVPQGIPISNYLANFFGARIDLCLDGAEKILYIRYVDDLLLLAKDEETLLRYQRVLVDRVKSFGLSINTEKTKNGRLKDGLDFLGYNFVIYDGVLRTGIRQSSYQKHFLSILKVFSRYAAQKKAQKTINMGRFAWDLNLKITGVVLEGNRYGWLFFFSQIDEDASQLYSLDVFVDDQLKKYGLSRADLKIKRHSRALMEIRKNLNNTKYIPKDEDYTTEDKKVFLRDCCDVSSDEIALMSDDSIDFSFRRALYKEARQLEKDRGSIS